MAAKKETTKAAVKTAAPKAVEVKAEAKKVETPVVKEAPKAVAKKAEAKVEAPAKAEKPVVEKKAEVKKAEPKKAAAKKAPAKKAAKAVKAEIAVQFDGKSYTQEDLVKIAKDVWVYDLLQKEEDLVSVELYVKPEENMVYYVMNQEFTGSFYI